MLRRLKFLIICLSCLLMSVSCKSLNDPEDAEDSAVFLNGQVLNSVTNTPVDSAVVRIFMTESEVFEMTDSDGNYNIEISVVATMDVDVIAFKESYVADTTTVLAVPGRTISVPTLFLEPTSQTPSNSGDAASIILAEQPIQNIGVRESGALETAELVFEAQDSTGSPLDLAHSVTVFFSIVAGPGGGEFISPQTATTANDGRVSVYLTSGTIAGIVQVQARVDVAEKTILSQPVAIAIHGGLPDGNHFCLAVEKVNFPGYNIFGLTDVITAYVGDKYTNPVRPGTVVYFSTTGGIIQGSAITDNQGLASVTLISAQPLPNHPTLGLGFATVTGTTADEDNNIISAETVVLFSGIPAISVIPMSINIPNGSSQTFCYTVSDQNGNPLAEGTSIAVTVDGENVKATGSLSKSFPDTQSKNWTSFSFALYDVLPDTSVAAPVSILIKTSGPNGFAELEIYGISN